MIESRGVVVITGASAGVGRATAVAFAQRGFDVALLARGGSICQRSIPHSSVDVETPWDRHSQPVPPIYQPEIPVRWIVRTALDGRRAKIIGSWNKLLVAAGQVMPGLGHQYAAIGAWDSQLTDEPVRPGRPDNLRDPGDQDCDAGSHGIFDDQAGGIMDPAFLKTFPTQPRTFAVAATNTARDRAGRSNRKYTRSTDPAGTRARARPEPNHLRGSPLPNRSGGPLIFALTAGEGLAYGSTQRGQLLGQLEGRDRGPTGRDRGGQSDELRRATSAPCCQNHLPVAWPRLSDSK